MWDRAVQYGVVVMWDCTVQYGVVQSCGIVQYGMVWYSCVGS